MEAGSLECLSGVFDWVLDNFHDQAETSVETTIESNEFAIQNIKLLFRFYKLDPGDSEVSIGLNSIEGKKLELDLVIVSLVAKDGSEEVLCREEDVIFGEDGDETLDVWSFREQNLHPKFLLDDKLHIRCRIDSKQRPVENVPHLAADLRNGLSNLGFCDAVLVCGDREFNVHRFILAARSPVFSATFSHTETIEGKTVRIIIEDIEPETLDALITFAYTDQVEKEALTFLLLAAADKYDLPGLRVKCEQELIRTLDVENAVDYFIGAYLLQATDLKKSAANFVIKNHSEVKNIDSIANQHPKAMLEIFEMACPR